MNVDVVIVGGGIAGLSLAYELAGKHRVIVVEAEARPGTHSTGRSAALFSEIYGNTTIRALSQASRSFFDQPKGSFSAVPLLRRRGALFLALAGQADDFALWRADADVAAKTRLCDLEAVKRLAPIVRSEVFTSAAFEREAYDVDVEAMMQAYARGFRARGGALLTDFRANHLERRGADWIVSDGAQELTAPILVNAAGAWADALALRAGIAPLGISPRRRTAVLVDSPVGFDIADWPLVIDVGETFYFKPDAGRLLLSPADETETQACDAQPEELDVATAVHRFEEVTGVQVKRVTHRWAGLRSFSPDRTPVVGFDGSRDGFFWLAGQGGYGIQTAPAVSRMAAALIAGQPIPTDIGDAGVCLDRLSPARFRASYALAHAEDGKLTKGRIV